MADHSGERTLAALTLEELCTILQGDDPGGPDAGRIRIAAINAIRQKLPPADDQSKAAALQRREAVNAFLQAFASGPRYEARQALERIKDPAVIPCFVAALRSPDEFVRGFAAEWLVKLGRVYIEKLLQDVEADVRVVARDAYARLPGPVQLRPLVDGLSDPVDSARWRAARALWTAAKSAPLEALAEHARHESANVRAVVARFLGKLHGRNAIPALRVLGDDPDPKVRWWAEVSLDETQQPTGLQYDFALDGHLGFGPPGA